MGPRLFWVGGLVGRLLASDRQRWTESDVFVCVCVCIGKR